MKRFFAAFLFIPFFSSAQDTCQLKKETDPFTHETKMSTGFVSFSSGANRVSISIDATSSEIDFFIWFTNDSKCFDDESTIQVNYEGERLKANFKNSGSMNCEGAFHFTFRNTAATAANLKRLTDHKVASFHITGANKTVIDVVFTPEQKDRFMRMASCVVLASKALIKQ
jgi:hypothetical protein